MQPIPIDILTQFEAVLKKRQKSPLDFCELIKWRVKKGREDKLQDYRKNCIKRININSPFTPFSKGESTALP